MRALNNVVIKKIKTINNKTKIWNNNFSIATLQYLENIYTMFSSEPVTSKETKNPYQTFLKLLGIVSCLRRILFLLLTAP
jgi:hypothetical protein